MIWKSSLFNLDLLCHLELDLLLWLNFHLILLLGRIWPTTVFEGKTLKFFTLAQTWGVWLYWTSRELFCEVGNITVTIDKGDKRWFYFSLLELVEVDGAEPRVLLQIGYFLHSLFWFFLEQLSKEVLEIIAPIFVEIGLSRFDFLK